MWVKEELVEACRKRVRGKQTEIKSGMKQKRLVSITQTIESVKTQLAGRTSSKHDLYSVHVCNGFSL